MRIAGLAATAVCLMGGVILALFLWGDTSNTGKISYVWEFADAGYDADGNRRTLITLDTPGNQYTIGVEFGECWKIDGVVWQLLPNEVASAMCWHEGSGVEIGVFQEGNSTVVKRNEITYDDVQNPELRGPFQLLFSL